MKYLGILTLIFILVTSCTPQEEQENATPNVQSYNFTILLDLSDRLVRDLTPAQMDRDLAIVENIIGHYKNSMERAGAFLAKDKIRILFRPTPNNPNINNISKLLNEDLTGKSPAEKKEVFDNIEERFISNLTEIYSTTLKDEDWIGSDVWRFFRNDALDLSVESDSTYRNILFILSDGYVYHQNSARREGNRSTYITNRFFDSVNIYDQSNWRGYLEENNFGLVDTGQDLNNLEVLFLEVNPVQSHLVDEEIIRWYLSSWFEEMNIKDYRIYNTDMSSNTIQRIDNYLSR